MSKIVIVTSTFYKSTGELRFRLACDMVKAAVADGHRVVIVDCSPAIEVSKTLRELGAMVYPQLHKGMGAGHRQAFFHGWEIAVQEGDRILLWTEPEKVDLVRWVREIIEPLRCDEADIVIPARSEKAWSTWPAFQKESEQKANEIYNETFGVEGFDPTFGPVAFTIDYADSFVVCNSKEWGVADTYIQHYAPIFAERENGARIARVLVDMVYPPEQRAEEEGALNEAMVAKRKWQLETLSSAYVQIAGIWNKIIQG